MAAAGPAAPQTNALNDSEAMAWLFAGMLAGKISPQTFKELGIIVNEEQVELRTTDPAVERELRTVLKDSFSIKGLNCSINGINGPGQEEKKNNDRSDDGVHILDRIFDHRIKEKCRS